MKQILFAAFEVAPFIKTGGLGDVAGSLPQAVCNDEFEVRVIMPKLSMIPQEYKDQMTFITSFAIPLGWRLQHCGLFELEYNGIHYYFIDNEYYFNRNGAYGFGDDAERVAFFSKAILESLQHMGSFFPNVIHCNDWHTALVPVFLHEQYWGIPIYRGVKTIFSIHNLKFQGVYGRNTIGDVLGLHYTPAEHQLTQGDACNFMQAALRYSDRISTVSPTYANEICTSYYGERLDWLLNERRSILSGILNGIDVDAFNPETDAYIPYRFSIDDPSNKRMDKEALQKQLNLPVNADIPMIGLCSRLTEQKGLDLLTFILGELLQEDVQIVILGTGDAVYENAFRYYAGIMPNKLSAQITFSNPLSHKLYAACDLLLMPSQFEPCGLSQMIAMRYGTLPVVRETGGLKDSVKPYNRYTGEGNGFSFANFNAHELLFTIKDALKIYRDEPEVWKQLMHQAMAEDWSWSKSAVKYRALYNELIDPPKPAEPAPAEATAEAKDSNI